MASLNNKNRIYLVKDKKAKFAWSSDSFYNTNRVANLTLFQGNHGSFVIPPVKPSVGSDAISGILTKVEAAVRSVTNRTHIEMYYVHSATKNSHNFGIRMDLEKELIQKLKSLLTDVKICVQGTLDSGSIPEIPFHSVVDLNANKSTENFDGAAKFVQKYHNCPSANSILMYSIFFEWKDKKFPPTTNLTKKINVLGELFANKVFADCCIVTEDNKELICHKNILAVNSDVINAMLTTGLQESQTNRLDMTDISEEVVNKLLAYMYGLEINIEEMKDGLAFELIQTAHKYNVSPLEDLIMQTLLYRPNYSFDIDNVLPFYYFTKKVMNLHELSEKMLDVLKSKPKELVSSSVYQELLKKNPEEGAILALKLLELGGN